MTPRRSELARSRTCCFGKWFDQRHDVGRRQISVGSKTRRRAAQRNFAYQKEKQVLADDQHNKEAVKSASGYSYDKKDGVWNPK